MRKATTLALLAIIAANARADAPMTVLFGATLTLTTTSFETEYAASSYTKFGLVQTNLKRSTTSVIMPGLVLTGYIERYTSDRPIDWEKPASATLQGNPNTVMFWLEKDLIEIKHPAQILVSTGSFRAIRIDPKHIDKISKRPSRFDGRAAYRQPFYMPPEHAHCLRDAPPFFQCAAKYTYNAIWISCNPEVGAKELGPICARDYEHRPTEQAIDALTSKGKVFIVGLADE